MSFKINNSNFLITSTNMLNYPQLGPPEVIFAGRSNVGKSSLINCLTNRKKIAKVSNRPGRTQQINFFSVNEDIIRLVDLPGYGFARVPFKIKFTWNEMIETYILTRKTLIGAVVIIDIRHNPYDMDIKLINWLISNNISIILVATKIDKLSNNKVYTRLKEINSIISKFNILLIPFSSIKKIGNNILWNNIWNLHNINSNV